MLLENKTAVIYGGGGAIGGAVARAFAREGARLFLAGRTRSKLEAVAESAAVAAGSAEGTAVDVAVLDALDRAAVDAHADHVIASTGAIDVSFNLISHGDVQGTPMVEMDLDDYLRPVVTAVRTTLVTASAAARHMRRQANGGVILMFGGAADPPRGVHLGGLQTAFHAMEAMRRQLSSELAADGVRVITLKTSGVPESMQAGPRREAIDEMVAGSTLLGRAATLEDVGNAAAFAASHRARTVTAAAINISCGTFMD
jgi:NAD(P)-dependent dehydrogenase (short-subunit alcohol dehydrogenase family)